MNGRLYDPILRSFLMPDNFIQQPENTQNYNRFAYVLNNPLMYIDPSGEELISLGVAVAIGAGIAMFTYVMTAALTDVPFTVGGLAKATFIGAASAAVTFGIGTAAGNLFTNFFSKAAFQAVAHGTFQGTMTGLQGGNFWTGFAAGALSSIASSLYSGGSSMDGLGKNANAIPGTGLNSIGDNLGGVGMIAFGTVAGGAGASLTGGNFWQGAVTGLVVSGLNHAMHSGDGGDSYDQEDPPKKKYYFMGDKFENAQFQKDIQAGLINPEIAYESFMKYADAGLAFAGGMFPASRVFSFGSKTVVQFGKGTNQVSHTFRHVEAMGLNANTVKSAILKNIPSISKNVTYGGKTIYTQIKVGGQDIIYSAHRLQNGSINVGRITGL